MSKQPKLGPTGRFPDGKATPKDEGEIKLSIGRTSDGNVILDFGIKVAWVGMMPQQARELAEQLLQSAKLAEDEAH